MSLLIYIIFLEKKNYFEIDEIKNELIDVKKRSFLDRKKKVIDNIEQIKNNYNNDIKQKYISLLCLLINDNTNVDSLKEHPSAPPHRIL